MAQAKGCLTVFVGLLVLSLIVNIAELTWPVCLPAGIAVAGWFLTNRSRNPFETAAHTLLGPVAAGLVFLSALLLAFNTTSPASDTHTIHATERVLVYLDNVAPRWLLLSPAVFVTVLLALMTVTYWLPTLKLVSRFVIFKKWGARVTAALGAATSFTFFSNVAVLQPKTPDIYLKIEAIYRNSRSQEEKSVGRFLAARALSQALESASATDREYVRLLIDAVAAVPVMNAAGKQTLAGYVALTKDAVGTPWAATRGLPERPGLPHRRALVLLDEQLSREVAAGQFADEVTKGLRELMSKAFSLETAELKAIGWSFADKLLEVHAVRLEPFGRPYLDKVLDKYFERATEPVVSKWSEQIRKGMTLKASPPPSVVTARLETRAALIAMNKAETEVAIQAARRATEAVQTSKAAMKASETARANAELLRAERASSQALKAASLADAASESVLATAEVAAAIRAEAAGASIAATASESAQALRIVAGATEAAKAAKAAKDAARAAKLAAEAVEAARAAKAAAQAAEAVKLLF